jgi:ClpP class serine protease
MQVRLGLLDEAAPGLVIEGRVAGEGDRSEQAQEFLERLQARIREDFPGASASFRTLGDDAAQKVASFTMWLSPDAREPQRADELLRLFR